MRNLCVIVMLSLLAASSIAADNDFAAGTTGDWNVASNWSLNRVPDWDLGDTARIGGGSIVNLSTEQIVSGLFMGDYRLGFGQSSTLNIYDGANLHTMENNLFLAYGPSTANINMYGGSITNYDPGAGLTGAQAYLGWGGNVYWHQEGGFAQFFVAPNTIAGDPGTVAQFDVIGGQLNIVYIPTAGAGNWVMNIGGTGVVLLDNLDTENTAFTINPGGTMKIYNTAWNAFEQVVTYNGAPEFWTEGAYNCVTVVVPEPITLALLGVGGLLIRRRVR